MVLRLSVASRYAPLYLSVWSGGREKVTVCWRVPGVVVCVGMTTRAMLLALVWLVLVRCPICCVMVGGLGALTTLEGGAHTLGAGAGVCVHTLGVNAGVGAGDGVCTHTLGVDAGVRAGVEAVLKIERRLSTARSWAWQFSFVRSARMELGL